MLSCYILINVIEKLANQNKKKRNNRYSRASTEEISVQNLQKYN